MTSGLRKAHKYIWLLLVIIIPIIIALSIKDLDVFSSNNQTLTTIKESKNSSLNMAENDVIKVSVFENQIEIILKSTLKNSASVVYEMDGKGNKSTIIGQITTTGIYTFKINNLPKGIIIYDDLKQVDITKLAL
ncbi:MAG: hypothetical protein WA775_13465 [Psychroserpens sp.]|uniref:hypothetical protein n=1 Tax=Psychroserpens sp. TaxID=2020870 RepID=UPI003C751979